MELTPSLLNVLSVDPVIRNDAEATLKQLENQNAADFLSSLSGELLNEEKPAESREVAGLILKNAIDVEVMTKRMRWLTLDSAVKKLIKDNLLLTLSSSEPRACLSAPLVIGKVAGVEVPEDHWPHLIPSLVIKCEGELVKRGDQAHTHCIRAVFESFGDILEEVDLDCFDETDAGSIFTCMINGFNVVRTWEPTLPMRFEILRAAYRALDIAVRFASPLFSTYRYNNIFHYMMHSVFLDAIESLSPEIKVLAIQCLSSIWSTYYDKLYRYIIDTLDCVSMAFKQNQKQVTFQAMQLLNSICDKEFGNERGPGEFHITDDGYMYYPDLRSNYFLKRTDSAIVPMLLNTFTQQDETLDLDEEYQDLAMAAVTCLSLVTRTLGSVIIRLVTPFIEENKGKPDWRQRRAALLAVGSISGGLALRRVTNTSLLLHVDSESIDMVRDALDFMGPNGPQEPSGPVKQVAVWSLGKIYELLNGPEEIPVVNLENYQELVHTLLLSPRETIIKNSFRFYRLA